MKVGILYICFFLNYTSTTQIYTYWYTLSLHDALPISPAARWRALTPTPACAVHSARWRASCSIFWASAATCWATPSAPALRMASSRVRQSAPGSVGGGASKSAGTKGSGIGRAQLEEPTNRRPPVPLTDVTDHQGVE